MNNKISISEYKKIVNKEDRPLKYRNKRCVWKGPWRGRVQSINFDSQKEMGRFCELCKMERAVEIQELSLQERFLVSEDEVEVEHKIVYVADFMYWDNIYHNWIVEDVKGFKTDLYKAKKKLFLQKFPKIEFIEIV